MKRGFTLIELLAVIVILAIIALIATPIILGIIDGASNESIERSVENYLKAVNIAVAKKNLNEEFNPKKCIVQSTGNLLCDGKDLIVEVDGNHPIDGTITFTNGSVSGYTNLDINSKYANKGSTGIEITNEKKYICKEVETATLGTKASTRNDYATVKYKYGDEYLCDPGDGEERIFLVLEDGDTTTLTTGRVAQAGEVSLIMDRNFTDDIVPNALKWCVDGGSDTRTCQSINSKEEGTPLKHIQDTFGNNVTVSFATMEQIKTANGGSASTLPLWLSDYLNDATHSVSGIYAYWLSSSPLDSSGAGVVVLDKFSDDYAFADYIMPTMSQTGVRPVITISKSDIKPIN